MKERQTIGLGAIMVMLFSVAILSCNKVEETIATVQVVNSFGSAVSGAEVRLYAVGTPSDDQIGEIRFDTTQTTNASGKVSFNFTDFYKQGQAGFVVLDIEASKGTLYGQGIIKIEEEETNEESVTIE
ncbi:hypothetical protein [Sanyastnella coralliicola]|uniref:hypothetical protein n=1 Tax=Sanyastnella coralliicola TaxID=3069118 RepID=UPI0027BAA14F|nr:hypothetical protein [Longitalea sp. SCSIO 12813]